MYHTGVDPRTKEPVYIPKTREEKRMQRALLQYRNPKNYDIVYDALMKAGRQDLIGFDAKCLIKPREKGQTKNSGGKKYGNNNRGRSHNSKRRR
jgi:hypothetical protein